MEAYKNLSLEDIEGEVWKSIKGYEKYYQISNKGRIKALSRVHNNGHKHKEYIRRQIIDFRGKGYLTLGLSKNYISKQHKVHRLVAIAFIHNPKNKETINHIDCNPKNNTIENLEWCTHAENLRHYFKMYPRAYGNNPQAKRVAKYDLGGNKIREYSSTAEAAHEMGLWRGAVSEASNGENKTAGGYKWKYI